MRGVPGDHEDVHGARGRACSARIHNDVLGVVQATQRGEENSAMLMMLICGHYDIEEPGWNLKVVHLKAHPRMKEMVKVTKRRRCLA